MEAVNHFWNIYKQNWVSNMREDLRVLNIYQRFFTLEESLNVKDRFDRDSGGSKMIFQRQESRL